MEYNGDKDYEVTDQEVPALFMWRNLSKFVSYTGSDPWTNKDITTIDPAVVENVQPTAFEATENWAAFADTNNWGLGAYFPHTTKLGYYVVGSDPSRPENCSYFAPIMRFALKKGMKFEYDVFLTIGSITDIRSRFKEIRTKKK